MTMFRVFIDAGKRGNLEHLCDYSSFEQMKVWDSKYDFNINGFYADAVCPKCKSKMRFNLKNDESKCLTCGKLIHLYNVEDEL